MRMWDLLFREDGKATRVAKIKNKTHQKIQRNGREKIKRLINEAGSLDGEKEGGERMKCDA
jgi:U3 small nucleolar RNA-associated protein 14